MSQPNRQPPTKPVVVPTQSSINGPPLTMPAKQPISKGYAPQLTQGIGLLSAFNRSSSEQNGRLHVQPGCGSSSHEAAGQGQPGRLSRPVTIRPSTCAGSLTQCHSCRNDRHDNQEKHEFASAGQRQTPNVPRAGGRSPRKAVRIMPTPARVSMRYTMRLQILALPIFSQIRQMALHDSGRVDVLPVALTPPPNSPARIESTRSNRRSAEGRCRPGRRGRC